jgi:hypothetical protein
MLLYAVESALNHFLAVHQTIYLPEIGPSSMLQKEAPLFMAQKKVV